MYVRIKNGTIKMYQIKKIISLESGKLKLSRRPEIVYKTNPNIIPVLIPGREVLKR